MTLGWEGGLYNGSQGVDAEGEAREQDIWTKEGSRKSNSKKPVAYDDVTIGGTQLKILKKINGLAIRI